MFHALPFHDTSPPPAPCCEIRFLVLHTHPDGKPLRYDRWSQALEVTLGEIMPAGEPPLLKYRREITRVEAIKLWAMKRKAGWQMCPPQWTPPPPLRPC